MVLTQNKSQPYEVLKIWHIDTENDLQQYQGYWNRKTKYYFPNF